MILSQTQYNTRSQSNILFKLNHRMLKKEIQELVHEILNIEQLEQPMQQQKKSCLFQLSQKQARFIENLCLRKLRHRVQKSNGKWSQHLVMLQPIKTQSQTFFKKIKPPTQKVITFDQQQQLTKKQYYQQLYKKTQHSLSLQNMQCLYFTRSFIRKYNSKIIFHPLDIIYLKLKNYESRYIVPLCLTQIVHKILNNEYEGDVVQEFHKDMRKMLLMYKNIFVADQDIFESLVSIQENYKRHKVLFEDPSHKLITSNLTKQVKHQNKKYQDIGKRQRNKKWNTKDRQQLILNYSKLTAEQKKRFLAQYKIFLQKSKKVVKGKFQLELASCSQQDCAKFAQVFQFFINQAEMRKEMKLSLERQIHERSLEMVGEDDSDD